MDVFEGWDGFRVAERGIVLAIGNFDGLHRGHRRIIQTALRQAAALRTAAVVMTFEPHPLAVLAPQQAPGRLTTRDEKLAWLRLAGLDAVIIMRSQPALLNRSPEEFLALLRERCRPRAIVAGANFRFGRDRAGDVATLRRHAADLGYSAHVAELLGRADAPDAGPLSSSRIRRALSEGRIADANAMLGRCYRIVGVVGAGAGRGAPLGFATANLTRVAHLLPAQAVYAAVAQLESNRFVPAAVNIGPRPTFGESVPQVEAHLLDFSAELRGQRLGLHLIARLRGQVKFAGGKELAAQLERDVARARSYESQWAELRGAPRLPL